jgi:uncharacterized membrane protein YfcA
MKKNKNAIIVLALAAYTLIMAVFGYIKGSASLEQILLTVGGMAVLLCVLWFLLRKKAEIQNRHKVSGEQEKKS